MDILKGLRKTTLQIDDELVEQAARVLGTHGLKATIDRALREVITSAARRQAVDQLMTMEGLDLADPDVMDKAWRHLPAT